MTTLLRHSSAALLIVLWACSDRQPTRPEDQAAHPAVPAGQLADVATDAPATPADMRIIGEALGCFGNGCTPSDNVTVTVAGVTLGYESVGFSGGTANGVLAVNDPSLILPGARNFGVVTVSAVGQPITVSIPFTLRLTFAEPTAGPISIGATLRGTIGAPSFGGLVLSFDDKKSVRGEALKIDFVDPLTSTAGRMDLSVFGEAIQSGRSAAISGFFEIR